MNILYDSGYQIIDNDLIDSYHKNHHDNRDILDNLWPSSDFFKIFDELTKNMEKLTKFKLIYLLKNKPNNFTYLFEFNNKNEIKLTINLLESKK